MTFKFHKYLGFGKLSRFERLLFSHIRLPTFTRMVKEILLLMWLMLLKTEMSVTKYTNNTTPLHAHTRTATHAI